MDCRQRLMVHANLNKVIGDQYQYGQASRDGHLVKKPTERLSNSLEVVKEMCKRCAGCGGAPSRSRRAYALASGRVAKDDAIYPFKLCRAMLVCLRNQLRLDGCVTPRVYSCQAAYDPDDHIQTSKGAAASLGAPGTVRQYPSGTIC